MLTLALVAGCVLQGPPPPRLRPRAIIDVPSFAPEIGAFSPAHDVFVHIDACWRTLEVYQLRWSNPMEPPTLVALDLDEDRPGIQGRPFATTPTSVAAHPTVPVAIVSSVGRFVEEPGQVTAIDLRPQTLGQTLWTQGVGHHPDSVAISPDGRWLVVANEGEGDSRASVAPGSVSVVKLAGTDLLAHRRFHGALESWQLDVHEGLALDAGEVEPEYVAFDPGSRFALVTCQENDGAVVIDLGGPEPKVGAKVFLPKGSEPDGCAVLDGYTDPTFGPGCLIALAEEGKFDEQGRWLGQSVSFHWLGPEGLWSKSVLLSRLDVAAAVGQSGKETCPESVLLKRVGEHTLAFVGIERAHQILEIDVTDPRAPRTAGSARVGKRPEGLLWVEHGGVVWIVSCDEGDDGPGEVSFLSVTAAGAPQPAAGRRASAPAR
ncbi:MAG: hypothetical protein JNJ88_17535 [Planctomycetes bacterium]|nr:hypothetical protein [Planctomycetota bacterium]